MKSSIKWILIGLAILGLVWLIFFYEERQFVKELPESNNYVVNFTQNKQLDTIVHHALRVIEMDSLIILIKPLQQSVKELVKDYEIKAHIQKVDSVYVIYIENLSRYESISIIAHEFAHLLQYQSGDLVVGSNYVIWMGDTTYSINYYNSPWEEDARRREHDILVNLKQSLYHNTNL